MASLLPALPVTDDPAESDRHVFKKKRKKKKETNERRKLSSKPCDDPNQEQDAGNNASSLLVSCVVKSAPSRRASDNGERTAELRSLRAVNWVSQNTATSVLETKTMVVFRLFAATSW